MYRSIPEGQNKMLFNTVLVLCLITLIAWLVMKYYVVAGIYLLVLTILWHTYYYTFYYLEKDYLIIKIGFIKVKIKYNKIKNVKEDQNYVVLIFKKFKLHINPSNKDKFLKDIKKKVK